MTEKISLPLMETDLFRSAFAYSPIGMALVGTDGAWLEVNDSVCRITGYSREELLEKTFQDITHPDDLENDLSLLTQLLNNEIDHYEMEKRYFHKNGHIVWILLTVSLVRNSSGEPSFFVSQIQDFTERKNVERQLHQRKSELRSLLNHTQIVISRLNYDSRHLYINSAIEKEIGFSAEQLTGKTFIEVGIDTPTTKIIERTIKQVYADKKPVQLELGNDLVPETRYYYTYFTPEFDENGEVETVLVITANITELKHTEIALREALSEIKQLQEILPICSYCKNVRDDKNYWHTVENYISSITKAQFSHSVCPDCYESEVVPEMHKLREKLKS